MELISRKGYEKLCEEYHLMDQKITDIQKKMGESAKRDNDLRECTLYLLKKRNFIKECMIA